VHRTADGIAKLGYTACISLREPSLGPVFGIKGGAAGGGYSQVLPMEDINLHFTGDLHAVTRRNNLLAALIDNHIFSGNNLNIERIVFNRCIDISDRSLRRVTASADGGKNGEPHSSVFTITAASEIMSVLCLSENFSALKNRLGRLIIGYTKENKAVTVKDLGGIDCLTILLKDAIKPNLVQTIEGTPAFVHGGPFANIAHGTSSIIATKRRRSLPITR
jgi:formate--tetrahydrofolate ligase